MAVNPVEQRLIALGEGHVCVNAGRVRTRHLRRDELLALPLYRVTIPTEARRQ